MSAQPGYHQDQHKPVYYPESLPRSSGFPNPDALGRGFGIPMLVEQTQVQNPPPAPSSGGNGHITPHWIKFKT